jgi:hypothetical protein
MVAPRPTCVTFLLAARLVLLAPAANLDRKPTLSTVLFFDSDNVREDDDFGVR